MLVGTWVDISLPTAASIELAAPLEARMTSRVERLVGTQNDQSENLERLKSKFMNCLKLECGSPAMSDTT